MSETFANNKRIAKNTLLLYVRMLFLMLVSLYTSRVVLNALGVEDYGIYNVVGGVVTMFSVLSGSLSAAISRFITFELGTGNKEKLKKVFSSSVTIQIGIALTIVVLAETVGLWFLSTKMVIPQERLTAANWCFQFSILTFAINLISVPYNAAIIAHEKMSAFAYISFLEAIGKLCIAWLIVINPIDRLIFFGAMVTILAIGIRFVYCLYCKHHFEECTYHVIYDHDLLKQMFGFAGWNFIGSSAVILRDQGGNIILNLFYGPLVNAAHGIAIKVNSVVQQFVSNFMTALNPQIMKSYASGDNQYMMTLIFTGARFSFYLLLLISLPLLLNTHFVLELWLKQVPEHSVVFVQLVLLLSLHETLANPLITAMLATGRIKKYQIFAGGANLLNLPVSYIFLFMGYAPEVVFIVAISFSFLVQGIRMLLLREMIGLNVKDYLRKVYVNVLLVAMFAAIIPCIMSINISKNILTFGALVCVSVIFTSLSVFFIGCNTKERAMLVNKAITLCKKKATW